VSHWEVSSDSTVKLITKVIADVLTEKEITVTARPIAISEMTLRQFEAAFPNEDASRAYLVARRWLEGILCPRCGNQVVSEVITRRWHWVCENCAPNGYRFSHITDTIFENTNKPLRDWFRVTHLMITGEKRISAQRVWRHMGFGSLRNALYMYQCINAALIENDVGKLGGIVEAGDAYIGGFCGRVRRR
jgi:hypothetical protein